MIQSLEVRGKSKGLEPGTLSEIWDSGSAAVASKGQLSEPFDRKRLRLRLRLGWKADGWEGGAFGPGRAGRISGGRLGSRLGKRDPGQLILILFYPTQEGCKKAGGKKIRLNQM